MESTQDEDFLSISTVLDELEKDLSGHVVEIKKGGAPTGKDAILQILGLSLIHI